MAITDQNEIKKVINIDAGNSFTILKDYKTYIDNLKKSLDELDKSSDEYKQTVQDIEKAEDRLNSMMHAGNDKLEQANAKYEELIDTLQDLEDQLNDVNDAGDKLDIEDQISDVTENIRDLVDETANSSDVIEEMGDSGVSAFGTLLRGADGFKGSLGVLNGNLGDTVRVLAQCGKAAMTAGTEAAAAEAIATGGLTLIISSLVLIITYWDEISSFLDSAMDKIEDLTGTQNAYRRSVEETEKSIADMNARLDESNEKLNFQLRLMRAQGATALEVSKSELNALNKQKNEIIEQLNKGYSIGITEDQENQLQDRLKGVKDRIKKTKEDIIIEQARVDAQEKARQEAEKARQEAEKNNLKSHNSNVSNIRKEHFDKEAEQRKREAEQREKEAQQILDRLHKENTDEITLLDEKYTKEKEILEKAGKETLELTEEYENKRLELMIKAADKQQAQAKKAMKAEIEDLKNKREQELYELQYKESYSDKLDDNKLDVEKLDVDKSNSNKFDSDKSTRDKLDINKLDDNKLDDLKNERERLDAKWEIEQEYYLNRIELQQEYLANFVGSKEAEAEAEKELDNLRQEYANKQMKYNHDVNEAEKKIEKQATEDRKKEMNKRLDTAKNVYFALGDLMGESEEASKLYNIMETTMSTLTGAIDAYKSLAGIPVVGPALGAAAAATLTAAGVANITKIKQTTKDNSPSLGGIETPGLSMTSVSPLLNEEADIQRMTSLTEQGDSIRETQNVRVYVVDQDIRDANKKAEVVENNATF